MAKKKAASNLDNLIGKRAGDETKLGRQFIDLPGGITDGVAQLIDGHLGVYKTGDNQGEKFLYLAGSIHEPEQVTAVKQVFAESKVQVSSPTVVNLVGQRTSNTWPLCARGKNSEEENVSIALNELRKVGVQTEGLSSLEDLEALLETVKEVGPFFKFSTSASTPTADWPNERVWENWNEPITDYEPSENDDMVDNTGGVEPPEEPVAVEPVDLAALGEAADADDEEAANTLSDLAKEAGIDPDDVATWAEVGAMLEGNAGDTPVDEKGEVLDEAATLVELGTQADEEGEESEAALTLTARAGACGLDPDAYATWGELASAIEGNVGDETVPEVTEVWKYKPPRAKAAKELVVISVDPGAKTVTLSDESTGKEYTDVPWSKLS